MSEDLTKLPWYGGNKIPESYLAKFRPKTEHDDLPHDLRIFLNQMGEMRSKQNADPQV